MRGISLQTPRLRTFRCPCPGNFVSSANSYANRREHNNPSRYHRQSSPQRTGEKHLVTITPLLSFWQDTVNIEKPESGYADIEITMVRRSFNGVQCPDSIIRARTWHGAAKRRNNEGRRGTDARRPSLGSVYTYLMTNTVAIWQLTRSATGWICGRVARLGSPMWTPTRNGPLPRGSSPTKV